MRSALVALLAAALATLPAVAPAHAASRGEVARLADAAVAAGVPGLVVAVGDRTGSYRIARGRVELGRPARVRAGSRFRIGSVTKPMTAVVVLRLAEEGRLSLDDHVERWVPGLLAPGATTTVRDLLRHTTGLGEYYDPAVILRPYVEGDLDFRWDARTLAARGVAAPAPRRAPSGFSYSDTNYVLAGLVAEAAGRRSFGELLDAYVVRPLHLRRTSYELGSGIPRGLARGYTDTGDGAATDVSFLSPSIAHASGAIVSDARDLIAFQRALLRGRLVSGPSLRQMTSGVRMGLGFPARDAYGLGLWTTATFGVLARPTPCGTLVGHNGEYPGYTSYAFARPDGGRQFVLLVSSDGLAPRARAAVGRLARAAAC